jgi:uncharacterized protein with NRDE domain
MCVIFLAYRVHPEYPLLLLANRDEFYERATAPAGEWTEFPEIFGGRDLVGGGTWLGITKRGRFAAVTNYREPGAPKGTISRGHLVADFLKSDMPSVDYLAEVEARRHDYSGFNLLVGEFNATQNELYYFSNRGGPARKLTPGIYGLSNHLLDTPWPKVRRGTEHLSQLIRLPDLETEMYFDLLANEVQADDAELPHTGVGYEIEKALSSIFIRTPGYGTRSSTVVMFEKLGTGKLEERVFF